MIKKAIIPIAAVALLLAGCKGRTTKDVEPTGETIEVTIDSQSDSTSPSGI